jgi:hypothetical protein
MAQLSVATFFSKQSTHRSCWGRIHESLTVRTVVGQYSALKTHKKHNEDKIAEIAGLKMVFFSLKI